MKKILFYAANGVGLGHLQRTRLIAEEIRAKNIKKILVTSARLPRIFGKFFDNLVQLVPLSDELLKNPAGTLAARLANGHRFTWALKKFKPNLIVADFHLSSPFAFYAFKVAVDYFPVKSVFVWRLGDARSFRCDLAKEKNKLDYFQKIILPHSRKELKDLLGLHFFKKIASSPKFKICGPIFRRPDNAKMNFCRRKYKILPGDFLITVALGGGGKLTRGRCDDPGKITKNFFTVYPRLVKAIPDLKAVIITGPYFENHDRKIPPGLKVVEFEDNLPELMSISDLVIAAAGYNTCNELIQAGTPVVLVPLLRGNYEQFERASYFERTGVAKVFNGNSSADLFNLIIGCKNNLNRMKMNFRKFSNWKQGNAKAAEIILELLNK